MSTSYSSEGTAHNKHACRMHTKPVDVVVSVYAVNGQHCLSCCTSTPRLKVDHACRMHNTPVDVVVPVYAVNGQQCCS
jgi:hypothetical protein